MVSRLDSLGPPLILLTSIALIAGFLLLLASILCWPLVPLFAFVTATCLRLCEWLVDRGDALPGGHWYVGVVPEWWLWVFYLGLLAVLMLRPLRQQWRWAGLALVGWLALGLVGSVAAARPAADELRVTFLAVGHGGCTVLETDGRVLLYDAGAMGGPEVTARQISPFLWGRGVRRIDEVFLSHADLDHYNGLAALSERFAIGQVTCTPTFADRASPAVRLTLERLRQQGVPVRLVSAGARLSAGATTFDVLHPPPTGPEGPENCRSLVLAVRHAGHTLLLTGDLEGPGLQMLLEMPAVRSEVLMAPHHGGRGANPPALAAWARPRVVVSCEGPPRGAARPVEPYTAAGAVFLGTWPHGAVTVTSRPGGLSVETFQTQQRFFFED